MLLKVSWVNVLADQNIKGIFLYFHAFLCKNEFLGPKKEIKSLKWAQLFFFNQVNMSIKNSQFYANFKKLKISKNRLKADFFETCDFFLKNVFGCILSLRQVCIFEISIKFWIFYTSINSFE
jgi:hypothetical protein